MFDAHLHILDPRFPLVRNHGYLPEPFTVDDYRRRVDHLGVTGGAVVAGSFHGDYQSWLPDALHRLGPGFVGVTQLSPTIGDATLRVLHAAGVRGVRFNLVRGGEPVLDGLDLLARRVFDVLGWPAELYVDSRDLAQLHPRLVALPRISIDHLGLSAAGFPDLLRLVERGARVKATGFGRVDLDVGAALRAIHSANPGALLFGTDLPGTRAPRPFADSDVALLTGALGAEGARRALQRNALEFYRA